MFPTKEALLMHGSCSIIHSRTLHKLFFKHSDLVDFSGHDQTVGRQESAVWRGAEFWRFAPVKVCLKNSGVARG